jgi:hypothetical protein
MPQLEVGIKSDGTAKQAFADEIFRVFGSEHPTVPTYYSNASPQVEKMITRVTKK